MTPSCSSSSCAWARPSCLSWRRFYQPRPSSDRGRSRVRLAGMGEAWRLLRDTLGDWYEDRAQRLGAALAFYTLFALAPGLVILIPLTGVFLGPQAAQGHIVERIGFLIGRSGAEAIEVTIVSARESGAGVTIVAVVTLVFGLWWVFGELQDALN